MSKTEHFIHKYMNETKVCKMKQKYKLINKELQKVISAVKKKKKQAIETECEEEGELWEGLKKNILNRLARKGQSEDLTAKQSQGC